MINIVMPILNKIENYKKILKRLADLEDVNVFIGIENKNLEKVISSEENSRNIYVFSFEDNTSMEEIINGLQKYVNFGACLILRKPISLSELTKFLNCEHDVATCYAERSKFKDFIFGIWQVLLKFFLGIKEYDGDTSVVYVSEDIATVIRESGDLSFSTRANRWRGVDQTTISVESEPVKKEIDKKNITKFSILASISFLIAFVVTLVVSLTCKVSIITGLLLVCLDMICLAITLITTIIIIFNCRVGKKKNANAVGFNNELGGEDE